MLHSRQAAANELSVGVGLSQAKGDQGDGAHMAPSHLAVTDVVAHKERSRVERL